MKPTLLATGVIALLWAWMGYNAMAAQWSPPTLETPAAPLMVSASIAYESFDIQTHNRTYFDRWDSPMAAQHTSTCGAPPGTHDVSLLSQSVFICNKHIMTSANGAGYGEIALTPNQLLDCSSSCVVQFDLSTQRQSVRDWWTIDLSPWADNLALPCDRNCPDLQGPPRNGLSITIFNGQGFPEVSTTRNGVYQNYGQAWWAKPAPGCSAAETAGGCTPAFNEYIDPATNQAAIRQPFKLTITPGHVSFERLQTATAPAIIFFDRAADVQMRNDYVVQFEHHSYSPEKDGAGIPATWHWFGDNGLIMGPVNPFTIIHAKCLDTEHCLTTEVVTSSNGLVTFDAPAPANAYLRFAGVCGVKVDGVLAVKQKYEGHPEHFSSYFVPIAQGKQSAVISFEQDDWFPGPCAARDFHVWAKPGPLTPTPTSTPAVPTSTSVPPTATNTPLPPTATATPRPPTPTNTPVLPKAVCTIRWGNSTIVNLGSLTQAECAARGN